MADADVSESCPICKRGWMVKGTADLTFHQMTDRGRVTCRVALPISRCSHCDFQTLDAEAEAAMDEAVRREYDKLPPRPGPDRRQ